jgi:hypothetical protein
MIPTTLAAMLWETWIFLRAVITNTPLVAQAPLVAMGGEVAAQIANIGSFLVGVATFVLGTVMAYYLFTAYNRWKVGMSAGSTELPTGISFSSRTDEDAETLVR